MSKSKITNLLVVPLIASAILLMSPGISAADTISNKSSIEIRHKTTAAPQVAKGVTGTVASVNGNVIVVAGKDDLQYNVLADEDTTIMKVSEQSEENPSVVATSDIHVGDVVSVRGEIDQAALES